MSRPTRKIWILAAVAMAAPLFGATEAKAWWGYYQPAYLGGCGYGLCYAPYDTSCYTTCYTPVCTVGCDPCGDSCGWYLGYRPGPIRQLLFGPYRWYYGGCYSWSCCYDPCCTWAAPTATATATEKKEGTPTRALRQPEVLQPEAPTPSPEQTPSSVPSSPTVPDTSALPPIPSTPATPLAPTPTPLAVPPTAVPDVPLDPTVPLSPGTTTPMAPSTDPTLPGPLDSPVTPAPTEPPAPTPSPPTISTPPASTRAPSPPFGGSRPATEDGSALLTVTVPLGSEVYINDKPTKSTGLERHYISKGLDPNLVYKYKVVVYVSCERTEGVAQTNHSHIPVIEKKKIPLERWVYLRAGEHEHLAFSRNVATMYETEMVPKMEPRRNAFNQIERDENGEVIMEQGWYQDPDTGELVLKTEERRTGRYKKAVIDDALKEIHTRLTETKLDGYLRSETKLETAPGYRPEDWSGDWTTPLEQSGI